MPYQNVDDLPQQVRDQLPEKEAQQIFVAAFNSIAENSGDEEAAARVAWQTIEQDEHYVKGDDGKYHRITEETGGKHGVLPNAPNS